MTRTLTSQLPRTKAITRTAAVTCRYRSRTVKFGKTPTVLPLIVTIGDQNGPTTNCNYRRPQEKNPWNQRTHLRISSLLVPFTYDAGWFGTVTPIENSWPVFSSASNTSVHLFISTDPCGIVLGCQRKDPLSQDILGIKTSYIFTWLIQMPVHTWINRISSIAPKTRS